MRKLVLGAALFAFTVLPSAASQAQTTLSYQPGVDGYEGLFDLIIGRNNSAEDTDLESGDSNVLGSSVENYFLDGVYGNWNESADEKQALMYFDGIMDDIPAGAKILSASLVVTTSEVGNAQTGGPYGVSQMLVPFDETTTYNNADDGFRFHHGDTGYPMANGFGSLDAGAVGEADVTEIIQNWVDGAPNYGFVITAGTTNGWSICTSGNTVATARPKLTITYTTDYPVPEVVEIVQDPADVDTASYWVKSLTDEWFDGDTVNPEGEYLDGTNPEDQAMLRFDNLFVSEGGMIPDGALIVSARLVVTTANYEYRETTNVGTGGEYGARQITSPWDAASTYASLTFGDFVDGEAAMITDAQAKFDVTEILQNWQAGDPNYGFNVATTGTTDGWCVKFSSATVDPPKLIVEYLDVLLGDANGDGLFNNADIEAFVLALLDRAAYEAAYPDVNPDVVLDFSGNGSFGNEDIEGFVDALLG